MKQRRWVLGHDLDRAAEHRRAGEAAGAALDRQRGAADILDARLADHQDTVDKAQIDRQPGGRRPVVGELADAELELGIEGLDARQRRGGGHLFTRCPRRGSRVQVRFRDRAVRVGVKAIDRDIGGKRRPRPENVRALSGEPR